MLHLMKLAVGIRDPAHLRHMHAHRTAHDPPLRHLTRHRPRRAEEIAGAGSMFWVIGGTMLVRQAILEIVPAERDDGSACAAILLGPALVAVLGRPRQGVPGLALPAGGRRPARPGSGYAGGGHAARAGAGVAVAWAAMTAGGGLAGRRH